MISETIAKFDAAVRAAIGYDKIHGVSIEDPVNKETWRIDFADDASESDVTAAFDVLDTFDAGKPTADDVRAEASRRMQSLVGARDADDLAVKVSNGTREAVKLLEKKVSFLAGAPGAEDWTADEAARAAYLKAVESAIDAIRAASNELEDDPPHDFASDSYWLGV